ncbi:MAG: hypothetical protein ACXIT4_06410 [Erythrobacter sp.]
MNRLKLALAAMAMTLPLAAPAAAQELPLVSGEYVQMTGIVIKDGEGGPKYAEFLATEWKRNQEYAKSQGWITGYAMYSNVHSREGEPDIYLVTQFASLPDAAESERRAKAYDAWAKTNYGQRAAASGNRAEYRTVSGSMLLREFKPR